MNEQQIKQMQDFAIAFKKWCDINFTTLSMERKKIITAEEMLQEFIKEKTQ